LFVCLFVCFCFNESIFQYFAFNKKDILKN